MGPTWTVQDKAQPVDYLTGALSIAVATTGGLCRGRRPAAAPKSRADLACGGAVTRMPGWSFRRERRPRSSR